MDIKNIEDCKLTISAVIASKDFPIKDIMSLGGGSIVAFDKLAGEEIDVKVNNTIIAKGEIVVIDENFGVRITEVL